MGIFSDASFGVLECINILSYPIYILSKLRLFKLPKLGPFEDHKVDAYFHELVGIPKAPSPRMASKGIERHRMYIYIDEIYLYMYMYIST